MTVSRLSGGHVSPEESARLKKLATVAAIGTASTLIAVKLIAWLMTDSVALFATLADSALDLLASAVNLVAVRHAITPADADHRFGHNKAESIAGLAQAAVIAGSATFLLFQSGERLIAPQPLDHGAVAVGVMAISIVLTAGLVILQRYVIARTLSVAIAGDSVHYASDIATNCGALVAVAASSYLGWQWADPIGGLLVAAVIAYGAWRIFKTAFDELMDRELTGAERQTIKDLVLAHREVRAVHDLRTRAAGGRVFIQFHIELDPEISLRRAHRISDEVEASIVRSLPDADVIIHQDPQGEDRAVPLSRGH